MRLLLIRHGQTSSNVKHLLDTAEPGPGLTPLGQQQAAALPATLAAERIDALYASTLIRTRRTAAPLAAATGLDVHIRAGIREVSAGDLEMRGDDEAIRIYLATTTSWAEGDIRRRMPGGENGVEALRRFDDVVAEAAATGAGTVAMVSHGAAVHTWTAARTENIDAGFMSAHVLGNTGVVALSGAPGDGWRAETWDGRAVG
ncbi:histidine phosphatase family protein [Streptomyces sp. NPDC002537]